MNLCSSFNNPQILTHCGCRLEWGGAEIRPESTGYGVVYMAEEVLKDHGEELEVSQFVAATTLPRPQCIHCVDYL